MSTLERAPVDSWGPRLSEIGRGAIVRTPPVAGSNLRRTAIGLDLAAAAVGWSVALRGTGGVEALTQPRVVSIVTFLALVLGTVAAVASQRLYLSRVCAIRAVEVSRLARAAVMAAVVALVVPRVTPVVFPTETALLGAGVSFVLLIAVRSGFRMWLQTGRRNGRFLRPVVVVGANEEAHDLYRLVRDHPETGFIVSGVAGSWRQGAMDFPRSLVRLGVGADLAEDIRQLGASGVLIASSALTSAELNRQVRAFLRAGLHVHLSSGLQGLSHQRLRSQPMAHEPLLYVEASSLARWQVVAKRVIDLAVATTSLLLALPVLMVAAVAIKIQDRGPVIYRQERVGRDGVPFLIYKLRTMVPDAEHLYDELAETLAGRDGPLIKLADDPRRTAVGRFLERSSIDELPQLWNVLRGTMSLVGPRPAQAAEVAEFDDELRSRLAVRPGITGLWQVEARDNPSFAAYRRYDLFYIENWSVTLDLAILLATFQSVAGRTLAFTASRRKPELVAARPRVVLEERA